MRIMKPAVAAVFAVLVFGAVAAATASAAHPTFVNQSGKALSFSASNLGASFLRALNLGVLGTVHCEKSLATGIILPPDEAITIHLEFSGNCLQLLNGTLKRPCSEPIKTLLLVSLLGLSLTKKVLIMLLPEKGELFAEVRCLGNNTTIEGKILGEFPENDKHSMAQYNKMRKEFELVFQSASNTENQTFTHFILSGNLLMEGVELKVSGFFGGKASLDATTDIVSNGLTEIKV